MSERILGIEQRQPADKYELDKQNNAVMEFFLMRGAQLYRTRFATEEARDARKEAISKEFTDRMKDIPSLQDSSYEMAGESVSVANITFESMAEDDSNVSLKVTRNRAELMGQIPELTTIKADFMGFSIIPRQDTDERGHPYYFALPTVNFMTKRTVSLADESGGSLINVTVDVPVVVPCDGRNEIHIPRLEHLKTRADALGKLALTSDGRELAQSLHKLVEAIETEQPTFTPLKKPQILHEIARHGAKDSLNHDLVATAIGSAIGHERPVRLVGSLFSTTSNKAVGQVVDGNVVGVLLHNPATDIAEPTLVVEAGSDLKYAPLSQVTRFEF